MLPIKFKRLGYLCYCWKMIVCSDSEQTEGLPFVIGAKNKRKLSNTCN